LFNYNCEWYEQEYEDQGIPDATPGKKSYGVRILALGTLRMLGRDIMFDDLEDLNGASAETNSQFFHGFVTWLSSRAKEFIKLPESEEELKHGPCLICTPNWGFQAAQAQPTASTCYWTNVRLI
jgi:hypothetical protein